MEKATREELVKYMEMIRDIRRKSFPDVLYAGMEDLLLQHGTWFEPPTVLPKWKGPLGQCYWNAHHAAKAFGWTYVEGIAVSIIPAQHGWCIDKTGAVQEVTWEEPGVQYVGASFKRTPSAFRLPIFANPQNHSIYTTPFVPKRGRKRLLSAEEVSDILTLYRTKMPNSKPYSMLEIAKLYRCSVGTIQRVLDGKYVVA